MNNSSLLSWCSWCFEKTKHDLVQKNYLRRNVYQCTKCLNRTLECRFCQAMCRGHQTYDDERCAVHDGTIAEWGSKPEPKKGYCSWCLEFTSHKLIEKNVLAGKRDVYECMACGRRTLPCRSDTCNAFSRGHNSWDDEECIKCDGTISKWGSSEENRKQMSIYAWCSWCFSKTNHTIEQVNNIGRDVYICEECLQRTLRCMTCDSSMVRGGPGWDDNRCSKCRDEILDWIKQEQKKKSLYQQKSSVDEIKKELERKSEFKSKAYEAGMVRPFLFLVSMYPEMRNQIASSLGWSLIHQDYFGNAHAEAWDIINTNAKGIQARTNESWETLNPFAENCNWHETLYHVNKEMFNKENIPDLSYSKSIEDCRKAPSNLCNSAEQEFIKNVSLFQQKHMTKAQIVELDELMDSEEVAELSKEMEKAGINKPEVIRYAINTVYQSIRMGGFNSYIIAVKVAAWMNRNLGTKFVMSTFVKRVSIGVRAANVIGWIWLGTDLLDLAFGSNHCRLFPSVNLLCTQRLLLASEGIKIEDYY